MGNWDELEEIEYREMKKEEKICVKCKESKPFSEFHKNRFNRDGLTYSCKLCRKKRYLEKKRGTK